MPKKSKGDMDVSDEDDNFNTDGETLDVDIEGYAPQEKDKSLMQPLLSQLFRPTSGVNPSHLANYIIAHNDIGTLVKNASDEPSERGGGPENEVDDDDNDIIFAITTLINLSESTAAKWPAVSQIRAFLKRLISNTQESSKDTDKAQFIALLEKPNGKLPFLLVNERFINLPPTVCANSLAALVDEMESIEDETERPTHLIVLSRARYADAVARANPNKRSQASDRLEYLQPEIETLRKLSVASIQSEPVEPEDGDDENECKDLFYVLSLLEAKHLKSVLDEFGISSS